MTIPLQSGIIYGPVQSRRLGRSLGLNIVSTKIKTCTFNCVYCQYGLRRVSAEKLKDRHWYPSASMITGTLEKILPVLNPPPAFITFSGNGESTLHPHFMQIVEQVARLRDQLAPNAKTAILSNSSTVTEPSVREALKQVDKKIMKLDCGDEETFVRYNQPMPGIKLKEIVSGLKKIERLTVQSLFTDGSGGNYTEKNMDAWLTVIADLSPVQVQIYSLDRSYPSTFIQPLPADKLLRLKQSLRAKGIKAEVY